MPVVREIMALGHEAVIAADGRAYDLLRDEFPEVKFIRLKGYRPVYPAGGSMVLAMALQLPKFLSAIAREHFQLKKVIRECSIDAVISDNRYGLWSEKIPSVFITHQLFIRMPAGMHWMEPAINRLNHFFISRYTACWIPDAAGSDNLSGALSHGNGVPGNARYIGMVHRLTAGSEPVNDACDLLAVISGPEPQRTLLEAEITKQALQLPLRTLIVRGMPESSSRKKLNGRVETVSHLSTPALSAAMRQAKAVVCRAGYSTLMELMALQKKAIIIPTPGQTEQEYLADRCMKLNYFVVQKQAEINLMKGWVEVQQASPPLAPYSNGLRSALSRLLHTG